jgi:prolipoprotein diacylglyceryl transferase
MDLAYIYWDVDPEIFRLGSYGIRWYGLFFALSFILGYAIMGHIFKREKVQAALLDRLTTYMVIGTVIGARLGHCLFYEPSYYLSNPIKILKIWEGGLASHGAAVGILIALYFFSKSAGKTYLWILDRIVIVVALAGFFIRMGNLMNSEIYGTATRLPWGFVFARYESLPKHPTQIYEGLSCLLIALFLYITYRRRYPHLRDGLLFGWFLVLLFSLRFLIEFIKEPQVGFEKGMILNMGQLLSIPFILLGAFILYRTTGKKPPA